jgi:isopentenyl-diphosphate Delta-isomerase
MPEIKDQPIDVLDSNWEKTGESQPFSVIHRDGLLHKTVHVWIATPEGKLLIQKRGPRWAYPYYWEASVGCHLTSDTESIDGACSRTLYELGVHIIPDECELLFSVLHPQDDPTRQGNHICHEVHDVYLVRKEITLDELVVDDQDIVEVRLITFDEFAKWVEGKGEPLVPHPEYYSNLLLTLKATDK